MTYRFEFDPTASNPANKISNESFSFSASGTRVFIPAEGRFYTRGMKVTNAANGVLLVPTVDYWVLDMDMEVTMATGFETGYGIVVRGGIGSVVVDYQAVGGDRLTTSARAELLSHFMNRDLDTVYWRQIVGRPLTFPPAEHMHSLSDLKSWDSVVARLDLIVNALTRPNVANQDILIEHIVNVVLSRLN